MTALIFAINKIVNLSVRNHVTMYKEMFLFVRSVNARKKKRNWKRDVLRRGRWYCKKMTELIDVNTLLYVMQPPLSNMTMIFRISVTMSVFGATDNT